MLLFSVLLQNMTIDRKWIVKESGNPAVIRQLSSELGIDHVLANLLVQRNITTSEQAREFFRPELSKLHDPFLMKDMDKAVERLNKAIDSGEKILIFSVFLTRCAPDLGITIRRICFALLAGAKPPSFSVPLVLKS